MSSVATPPTIISAAQDIAAPSPKVSGGVLWAPPGTALPTDATSVPDSNFISLGRVSDQGVDKTEDRPKKDIFDWGGGLIAALQDHYMLTLKFKLLQMMNADVQRAAHGDDNVTVRAATASTGTLITSKFNPQLLNSGTWVIDAFYAQMNMRLVAPYARIITVGTQKWVHNALVEYELTVQCFADGDGNFAYEYLDDGITL